MAGEVPSGRVGEPEEPEQFVPIQVGEWGRRYGTIYVAREIWERLRPYAQGFSFYVQEGGRCRIEFDRPVVRLEVQRGDELPGSLSRGADP